jgi:hypothetical protein
MLGYLLWLTLTGVAVIASVPLGAIGSAMAWMAVLGAMTVCLWLGSGLGRWLLRQVCPARMGTAARRPRIRNTVLVLLLTGLLSTLALQREPPQQVDRLQALDAAERAASNTPSQPPLCYFWSKAKAEGKGLLYIIFNLGAHGRSPKRRAPCRSASLPGPGPYLPLLVAMTLSALLWLQQRELLTRPQPAQGTPRPAMPMRSGDPGALGADSGARRDPDNRPAAPIAESTVVDQRFAPSPATLAAVQKMKERRRLAAPGTQFSGWASATHRALRWAFHRSPILSCCAVCYLLGHVVSLAGIGVADRVAHALAPAALTYSFSGWPVLGIWTSCLVGGAAGAWILWRRR